MGNRVVSQAIPKVDYKALVTGKAVYTDDLAAKDSLVVKVLRSPHAHALIQDINFNALFTASFVRPATIATASPTKRTL